MRSTGRNFIGKVENVMKSEGKIGNFADSSGDLYRRSSVGECGKRQECRGDRANGSAGSDAGTAGGQSFF